MHQTDGDANVAGLFDPGDPGVPRQPTQVDADWLNAVQQELIHILSTASVAPVKGTWTQVLQALRIVLVNLDVVQTMTARKIFADGVTVTRSTANSNAVTATGSGTGTGVLANGGVNATGSGNSGIGATVQGGALDEATGNTAGSAGVGAQIGGGSIANDTQSRLGGTALVLNGGLGQAGRGLALNAQTGDARFGHNINVIGTVNTIAIPTPTTLSLNAGVAAYAGFGGPGGITPCYWTDAFGVTHLEGTIVAAASSSYVAATGPVPSTGKRSTHGARELTHTDYARVMIKENGDIQVDTGANGTVVDLSSVTYR